VAPEFHTIMKLHFIFSSEAVIKGKIDVDGVKIHGEWRITPHTFLTSVLHTG
jgi:hypothetical protein